MATETKTLTAQCYCKAVHFTLEVPTSKIPLKTHMCHCSICRYTHGTLCLFHAPLPEGVAPCFVAPSSLEALTSYVHPRAKGRRYFCSTCGCHIGDTGLDKPNWVISASIFDANKDDRAFDIRSHVCTKSAPGGGLINWLPRIGDRPMGEWDPDPAEDPAGCEVVENQPETGPDGEDRLRAECHCGGVSFTFPRPSRREAEHPEWKQYISPVDETKWAACVDLCNDCRLVSGTHASAWTFIPLSVISPRVRHDLVLGTSRTYASSEGVLRSFCGTCGATVFFLSSERGHDGDQVVDISVGILRAPEGPLAENWLTWRAGRVSWLDSGRWYDAEFADSLAEGMKEWGLDKYGEPLEFNIGSP